MQSWLGDDYGVLLVYNMKTNDPPHLAIAQPAGQPVLAVMKGFYAAMVRGKLSAFDGDLFASLYQDPA